MVRGAAVGACLFALLGGAGCHHARVGPRDCAGTVAVPPPGAVPRELDKITLPPYVIEAPDLLGIEVVQRIQVPEPDPQNPGKFLKDEKTGKDLMRPRVVGLPVQPVSGQFLVRQDGSVNIGVWGSVPVAGLTLEQAGEAIRRQVLENPTLKELDTRPDTIYVIVDVLAYNSKRYYVFFDGGGPAAGEQVASFPITGSETVLDAIANLGGLPDVASKRNIWIARRTPHAGHDWQILPVDWCGTSQHGVTATNYQILPGDRVYVKAQRLVTVDRTLARIFAPVERAFGITLLGAATVNQVGNRQNNNNNNNGIFGN
jgi:polysaccharide export outer membrane protein